MPVDSNPTTASTPADPSPSAGQTLTAGVFSIHCDETGLNVRHRTAPEQILWSSHPTTGVVHAGAGCADVRESRGFFRVDDTVEPAVVGGPWDQANENEGEVVVSGPLGTDHRWQITFGAIDDVQLGFEVSTTHDGWNRLELHGAMVPGNHVFGLGEQFTHLNMKGREVPILSQEPGIGRGVQPLTWLMNTGFGAGGSWHHTNAPAPWYITSDLQGFCLENYEYSVLDFRAPDRGSVRVFSGTMTGRIFFGETPLDLLNAYTRFAGRMRALPGWIQRGAIIGMQGGTEAVQTMRAKLEDVRAPIAAYWLQDWVGARKTSIGWQLWWNWELDHDRYPGWERLLNELEQEGVRVMTYLNPFLVDAAEKGSHRRNLFAEAEARGYLIRRDGEPYRILNTSFSAALVDLANPEAYQWMKDVIRDQLIATGASGWMAEFGEALPFDAELPDGVNAATFHNAYPEVWAKLNREAIEEAGRGDDIVFFMRAGFGRSPGHCTLFWMGDQLTSWTQEDGIKSTVIALLSSGFSGFSLNHSDIGGYTATTIPNLPLAIPGIGFHRGRELLHRWIELNAFTAVFRTHEGNQPGRHFQIDGDGETLAHFARFARVFAALADYRIALGVEAEERGYPLVRHPWLHHPDAPGILDLEHQFMLGPDIMMAPVLDPGERRVSLYLPAGLWRHLWTDEAVDVTGAGWFSVAAPPGFPAVFCRANAKVYGQVRASLAASDDLRGPMDNLIRPQSRP